MTRVFIRNRLIEDVFFQYQIVVRKRKQKATLNGPFFEEIPPNLILCTMHSKERSNTLAKSISLPCVPELDQGMID